MSFSSCLMMISTLETVLYTHYTVLYKQCSINSTRNFAQNRAVVFIISSDHFAKIPPSKKSQDKYRRKLF